MYFIVKIIMLKRQCYINNKLKKDSIIINNKTMLTNKQKKY